MDWPLGIRAVTGAVVCYQRAILWQIEGLTVADYRAKLLAWHEQITRDGPLVMHHHRFFLEARKP